MGLPFAVVFPAATGFAGLVLVGLILRVLLFMSFPGDLIGVEVQEFDKGRELALG
jgi:hypothetical protein